MFELMYVFAYTPVKALWVDHEWGLGVVFYAISHYFGDVGIIILKIFLLLMIFFCVFSTNQLRSNDSDKYRLGYYFLFFGAILPTFDNTIRSQCFTYFFFAMWLYMLDLVKKGDNKLIWIFPLSMLFWANMTWRFSCRSWNSCSIHDWGSY